MILTWGEGGRNPAPMQRATWSKAGADAREGRFVSYDVGVSAAQVLNERVTCRDDPSRSQSLESAHRSQAGFEPSVIGLVVSRH